MCSTIATLLWATACKMSDSLEEVVMSISPDSGIGEAVRTDEKMAQFKSSQQKSFLFPRRRMLKSLSQDSEYSLDYDAEHFLQEMGFGTVDPSIPDRFLPSLIHRLSSLPDTEIEGLHYRVVQSIGHFKRKEGKRRLFRNLSIGKESQSYDNSLNLLSSNNYPLMRSNTGPAEFPIKNLSNSQKPLIIKCPQPQADAESDQSPVPKSPISIVVSEASMDVEDKSHFSKNQNRKPLPIIPDDINNQPRDFQLNELESSTSTELTMEASECLLDESSSLDLASENLPLDDSWMRSLEHSAASSENEELASNDTIQLEINDSTVISCANLEENETALDNLDNAILDGCSINSAPTKPPLRRTSNAHIYRRGSLGSIIRQKLESSEDTSEDTSSLQTSNDKTQNSSIESSTSGLSFSDSLSSEGLKVDTKSPKNYESNESDTSDSFSQDDKKSTNYKQNDEKLRKHKYSRADSLSNFLSSMLQTENDSITSYQNSVFEINGNLSKSLIESDNDKSLNFNDLDNFRQISQNETLRSPVTEHTVEQFEETIEKSPLRKRRILRHMSSSFQSFEDADTSSTLKASSHPMDNKSNYKNNLLAVTDFNMPKLPLRNIHSSPLFTNSKMECCSRECLKPRGDYFAVSNCCRVPFPCDSFNFHNQEKTSCADVQYNSKIRKRNHKRKRFYSCPSSTSMPNISSRKMPNSITNSQMTKCSSTMQLQSCSRFASMPCSGKIRLEPRYTKCIGSPDLDSHNCSQNLHCLHNFNHTCNCRKLSWSNIGNVFENCCNSPIENSCRFQWKSSPDLICDFYNSVYRCPENYNIQRKVCTEPVRHCRLNAYRSHMISCSSSDSHKCNYQDDVFLPTSDSHCISAQNHPSFDFNPQQAQSCLNSNDRCYREQPEDPKRRQLQYRFRNCVDTEVEGDEDNKPIPKTHYKDQSKSTIHEINDTATEESKSRFRTTETKNVVEAPNMNFKQRDIGKRSEAQLEKKIRLFSKFFSNLGNLSRIDDKRIEDCNNKGDKSIHNSIRTEHNFIARSPLRRQVSEIVDDKVLENSLNVNVSSFPSMTASTSNFQRGPVYVSRVVLSPSSGKCTFKPTMFTSSISMQLNGIKDDSIKMRNTRNEQKFTTEFHCSNNRISQKTTEVGIQNDAEMDRNTKEDGFKHNIEEEKSSDNEILSADENSALQAALADLRGKLKSGSSEEASFWQEEMQKMKEENDRAWRARLERMESCLSEREEELRRVQAGNEELLRTLDRGGVPEQTPHGGRTDSAFEDDEECNIKANSPTQCTRSGCERLEQRLSESEQRADQLNLLLNRKLIELNKLQLSLSKQTKEMIELEKSYLQLQCRMRRNAAKPIASKLCSRKPAFVTKNIIPRSSPPASPQL